MRSKVSSLFISCLALAGVSSAWCQGDVTLLGGNASVDLTGARAFEQRNPAMSDLEAQLLHDIGETGFLRNFGRVKIGGAIRLGPTFNAVSCESCHGGNGRGALRIARGSRGSDTVVKVSLARGRGSVHGGPAPVPGIGLQIRDHATKGVEKEGSIALSWMSVVGVYDDGTPYEIRSPKVSVRGLRRQGPRRFLMSLRRTPPVVGQGLIDAIPATAIEANADPLDSNADGISGRVNRVWDVQTRSTSIGRFGFKAGAPTLKQQIAGAYATDMGVTNPLFHVRGERPDISSRILDSTTFYTATLAVPIARGQGDSQVVRGRELFDTIGCSSCHITTFVTGSGAHSSLENQIVHPFSDFLLHDMGAGLADNRPEFDASGSEWRTTPLWGIGLTDEVLQGQLATYLHDGRARSLDEAILWHGGEATAAQGRFKALQAADRENLIQFLRSL